MLENGFTNEENQLHQLTPFESHRLEKQFIADLGHLIERYKLPSKMKSKLSALLGLEGTTEMNFTKDSLISNYFD